MDGGDDSVPLGRVFTKHFPTSRRDRVGTIKAFLEQVALEAVEHHSTAPSHIEVEYRAAGADDVEMIPTFRFSVPLHINSSGDDDDCTPFLEPLILNPKLETFKSHNIKITSVITGERKNNTRIVTYTLSGKLADFMPAIAACKKINDGAGHSL